MKIYMRKVKWMIAILFTTIIIFANNVNAADLRTGIYNFPTNYQGYLRELQSKYPNWNFIALYTGISWDEVIRNENVFGVNLVPISYSDRWKNTNPNEYNVPVDGNWVDSSRQAVEYALDPRNFLNEVRVFQFEQLSYDKNTNSKYAIEKILYGTEFYDTLVNYLDVNGNRIYTGNTYSDLILNAAKNSGVSAFHLASRIKQEVGPFLSHSSISGNVDGYRGLYNFYNIGATSSETQMEAIRKGLQYALDGKGASEQTKQRYLIPWDNKEKAITGGAIFIGASYINKGQNTVYLQKFHVSDNTGGDLFYHQYMTNILAAYSEAKSIYKGYYNSNLLDASKNFIIPVYNNMPEINTESPTISPQEYVQDNTRVLANVNTTLNIRSGPGTSYESITRVGSKTIMTRISKSVGSGELWDRVLLGNGIIGYAFRTYLEDVPKDLSQNELSFDSSLRISNYEISGIDEKTTVANIKNKINTKYIIEIENKNGVILSDNEFVGTGCILKIKSNTGELLGIYKFILYGDTDGDGRITSFDVLVLQRHILRMEILQDVFYKAGNISKNGDKPTSFDALLMQMHILKIRYIDQ